MLLCRLATAHQKGMIRRESSKPKEYPSDRKDVGHQPNQHVLAWPLRHQQRHIRCSHQQHGELRCYEEQDKQPVVATTHAVPKPRAMVVKHLDTIVTQPAVMSSGGSLVSQRC